MLARSEAAKRASARGEGDFRVLPGRSGELYLFVCLVMAQGDGADDRMKKVGERVGDKIANVKFSRWWCLVDDIHIRMGIKDRAGRGADKKDARRHDRYDE